MAVFFFSFSFIILFALANCSYICSSSSFLCSRWNATSSKTTSLLFSSYYFRGGALLYSKSLVSSSSSLVCNNISMTCERVRLNDLLIFLIVRLPSPVNTFEMNSIFFSIYSIILSHTWFALIPSLSILCFSSKLQASVFHTIIRFSFIMSLIS